MTEQAFGVGANVAMIENGPWVLHAQKASHGGFALTLEHRSASPAVPGRAMQVLVPDKAAAAVAVKALHGQFDKVSVDLAAATTELQRRSEAAQGDQGEIAAAMADFQAKASGRPTFPFKDEEIMDGLEHLFGDKVAE